MPSTINVVGEHVGVLNKLNSRLAAIGEAHHRALHASEEIDSVYMVFNEFKSVIAQRLVVEQILPIEQIGEPVIALANE